MSEAALYRDQTITPSRSVLSTQTVTGILGSQAMGGSHHLSLENL